VLITHPVVAMFEQQKDKSLAQSESGGILIGCYRGPHVEITGYTAPGTKDIRLPYRFIKQDDKHQHHATNAWRISGGTDTYIGEWHTHPRGAPRPSSIDNQTWRELVAASKRMMVFVIVSPEGWAVYRCQRKLILTPIQQLAQLESGPSGLLFRTRSMI
jgi:integrative and conjugative element protein (TIGR02256 family)